MKVSESVSTGLILTQSRLMSRGESQSRKQLEKKCSEWCQPSLEMAVSAD